MLIANARLSKPLRFRTARGFTVIEVAVALTVLALLMAAVAPMAGSWAANMQIRSAAESLQAGLQRARMDAVRRNQTIRFSLVSLSNPSAMDNSCAASFSSASWVISINDPSGKCGNNLSDTADPMLVETFAAGPSAQRLTVAALQSDGASAATSVTFDGFGRVVGGDPIARIDIDNLTSGNDFRRVRIVVATGGGIRMCDPQVVDAADPRRC